MCSRMDSPAKNQRHTAQLEIGGSAPGNRPGGLGSAGEAFDFWVSWLATQRIHLSACGVRAHAARDIVVGIVLPSAQAKPHKRENRIGRPSFESSFFIFLSTFQGAQMFPPCPFRPRAKQFPRLRHPAPSAPAPFPRRGRRTAPVDSIGCERLADPKASKAELGSGGGAGPGS